MCALRLNNESSVLSCSGCGRYDSGSGSWALLMAQLFMCHKFVSGVGGVGHNLSCMPQDPRGGANDMLQSAPVLGSGSSLPDGDGECKDVLSVGGVEVRHHCLWKVKLPQL